ncbi:MAG: MFS transporter [Methylobacter sp.]|uniref:MFS transporter n=1 Tax=Methylobacter sp. TaxID=2051955 RepID=UPI0025D460EE|nr:MFS transporter [Methylobacter sp.]MCK9621539.1 MFS transporter [Methylobacter sp.]
MNKLKTLSTRYFLCHLLAGSTNSFVDLLLKNGVIVYAAFKADMTASNVGLIATLSWSLFILPFFIFSAHGGYLGDRYDKRKVSMALRAIDIFIAAFAAFGFLSGNIGLLLVLIFAKGITSTLFGPLKYAMLSECLPPSALATGSSLMEAGTMIAILSGTYIGAIYGAHTDIYLIGSIALAAAIVSFSATCFCTKSAGGDPKLLSPSFNPLKSTFEILLLACQDRRCIAAIIALSWYWSLGAVYLSNVTALVRTTLLGDEKQVASILLIFTLGVSSGLAIGSYWLHGKPNTRVAIFMTVLIGLAGIDLYGSIPDSLLRMQFDFFTIAFASGVYAAHFSSVLYLVANQQAKARIFAAYNIMSSLLAVLVLMLSAFIVNYGVSLPLCLSGFAVATIPLTLLVNRMIQRHS